MAGHRKLPTYDILKQHSILQDDTCKWCNNGQETSHHLFFQCTLAKLGWTLFQKWLEVDNFEEKIASFFECFLKIKTLYEPMSGSICLAAMFWSIWVARNELVFRNSRISSSNLESVIKYRAFTWARAANLVSLDLQKGWAISPSTSTYMQARKDFLASVAKWSAVYNYLGFIDGAYLKKSSGQLLAGVGGFLINSNRSCQLIFSGPVVACSG